nr:hypothetical protein [uncultured Carboxylicivirga sp.]
MKKLHFIFIAFVLILVACNQDDIKLSDGELASELDNNRLSFNSQNEFDLAINALKEGKSVSLPQGFIALNHVIEPDSVALLANETNEDEQDTLVVSDYFSSLLNKDHEIEVNKVIYKVTPNGTYYASRDNYDELIAYVNQPFNKADYQSIYDSDLNGTDEENSDIYQCSSHPNIKMVDTFSKLNSDEENTQSVNESFITYNSSAASEPKDEDFLVTSFKGTWAGKLWDSIWGFSKSVRNKWDKKNRMDAKFYSQNFKVYSEAGVKTKTQYKGWTGIWRKKDVSEIRSGYEVLILQEKWPNSVMPPNFDPVSTNYLPKINVGHGSYYVVGNGETKFKNETRFTVDILGFDLDVTQKDINRALYQSLKAGGKFLNKDKDQVAIRVLDPWGDLKKTTFYCYNKEKKGTNTDKVTFIFKSDFGGVIGYKYNTGNPQFNFNSVIAKAGAPKLNYKEGTILYGVALKGSKWKGVRFEFK